MMKKFLLLLIIFILKFNLFAQLLEIKPEVTKKELGVKFFDEFFKQSQNLQYPLLDPSLFSLEKPIDPETYIIGPGDVLSVNIWSSPPLNFMVQVTVEGTVIVPTVGEFKVSGLTLSEAKKVMIQKIKSKYIASEITTTLIAPRSFNVIVTGYVLNEGKYKVRSIDRVSDAILFAFLPSDSLQLTRRNTMIDSVSLRKILLKRGDKIFKVDLHKYLAIGEDKYNPYLLEGDWIVVQRRDPSSFVAIYGGVNKPGVYEFVQGDKLTDIIKIAGGVIESADVENVEIVRLNESGELKERLSVNLSNILNGKGDDVTLENNDRIFIPEKRTLKQNYTITVMGEVKYPGVYPISRNGTMLSEILGKVGINSFSDVENAYIVRGLTPFDPQREHILGYLFLKNFAFSREDSLNFSQELSLLDSVKFVAIDFIKIISGTADLELQDGDFIYIPRKQIPMVYVFGQVSNPGFVAYKEGKDYRYYISQAGGFSQLARRGEVKVIKRKTYVWYDADDTKIEPGDFIFVPKKVVREPIYYWNVFKDVILTVGAVASTVATIILIYNQLKAK